MTGTGAITVNATESIASSGLFEDKPFYGQPIGVGFGTWRAEGRPIWIGDVYTKNGKKVVDCAIGLGRCGVVSSELINVQPLRIYANEQLIVDRVSLEGWESYEQIQWRMYSGTATQNPDPLIVAAEGAAATPAFRGLIYMVFEAFPLEQLEFERLPFFDVELSSVTDEVSTVQEFTRIAGGNEGEDIDNPPARPAVDWKRKRFYTYSDVSGDPADGIYVHVYDLTTNTEIARNIVERPDGTPVVVGNTISYVFTVEPYYGRLIMVEDVGANRKPLVVVDPLTGTVLSTMGEPDELTAPLLVTSLVSATVSGTPQFGNAIVATTVNESMELIQVSSNGTLTRITQPDYDDIAASAVLFLVSGERIG